MRILVLSDTHRHIGALLELLGGDHRFDRIFHLGDMVSDAIDINSISGVPVDYVAGNCDWGSGAPNKKVVVVKNKKFYLCHGHREHVKSGDGVLRQLIRKDGYDGALYGHSHRADISWEGDSFIMNPGSISLPRDGEPSYGVITIDDNGLIHTNIARMKG